MTAPDRLTLDPLDGRETGLRLIRHKLTDLPESPPSPYAAEVDRLIGVQARALRQRLEEHALLADAFGYELADVAYGTEPDNDPERDRWRVRMTVS